MKTIISFFLFVVLLESNAVAQSLSLNTDGSTANTSAILDVKSTVKGILIPRMTAAQRIAISTPATGLIVYDTDSSSFSYYIGPSWVFLKCSTTAANDWSI